ncbi:MAG: SPOR domain-containing protein [Desulfobacteraceae bacterium]|nr:SPOR domain-containing protein [Desulfobacteraceae bacterium]MBC2753405.1 SPOR domain-containing protein [Desulfobacteraceae bacterium]
MAKTKTTTKRKPVWQLSRRGVYGSIALALTACAWTFFVGVLVGRGTAPVKFDMEKLGQDLHALREQVQHQQARQLEAYSAAVENKSNMDFYEDLKQPSDDPAIDPNLTRTPPQPTIAPTAPAPAEAQAPPAPSGVPVKRRMSGLQPKKKAAVHKPAPTPSPPPRTASPTSAGALTLQVASLQDAKTADEMVARLRKEGYSAHRTSVTIPGKGRWYRIQVGRFSDREQAAKTIHALESKGLKPILVSR